MMTIVLSPLAAADLAGPARVIDGDTIEVAGERIRLHGIDAPESAQLCQANGATWTCGEEATAALRDRIAGRPVACEERDIDRYDRIIAVCRVDDVDLNGWMVSEGWALAYRRYSRDYVDDEAAASETRRGMWRGEFLAPWEWRRGRRLIEAAQEPTGCQIKGNISSSGERIYHVPGGRHYDRTRINTPKGERWFCSEAEAQSAGWRRSRR